MLNIKYVVVMLMTLNKYILQYDEVSCAFKMTKRRIIPLQTDVKVCVIPRNGVNHCLNTYTVIMECNCNKSLKLLPF